MLRRTIESASAGDTVNPSGARLETRVSGGPPVHTRRIPGAAQLASTARPMTTSNLRITPIAEFTCASGGRLAFFSKTHDRVKRQVQRLVIRFSIITLVLRALLVIVIPILHYKDKVVALRKRHIVVISFLVIIWGIVSISEAAAMPIAESVSIINVPIKIESVFHALDASNIILAEKFIVEFLEDVLAPNKEGMGRELGIGTIIGRVRQRNVSLFNAGLDNNIGYMRGRLPVVLDSQVRMHLGVWLWNSILTKVNAGGATGYPDVCAVSSAEMNQLSPVNNCLCDANKNQTDSENDSPPIRRFFSSLSFLLLGYYLIGRDPEGFSAYAGLFFVGFAYTLVVLIAYPETWGWWL
ncbi:MAG: hypothetical protein AB1306_04765 [Nitrospirota bacterium]